MSVPTLSTLADRYACNVRTVKRWREAGVNVHDPKDVADYILRTPAPRLKTLTAVCSELKEFRQQDNEQDR